MSAALDASRDFEWSTDSVRGSSALSCWTDRVGACLTEVDIESRAFGRHRARIQHFELGPVQLNFLSATSQRIMHSTAMIKRSANDYLLLFFEKGAGKLRHYDLEVTAPEKCFVLLDNQLPYELLRDTGGITLSMRLQDAWLRHWLPHPKTVIASPIFAEDGWGSSLAATLKTISSHGLADAILPRGIIADQLGAFLALMMGGRGQAISRHRGELFVRLKRSMRARLDDPDLDPRTIADAVGISKRHLHGLFAQAGTTFGALLIEMRLERAANMLRDGRFSGYRAADVAWTCGFANASHFARRFRAKYGETPVRYRKGGGSGSFQVPPVALGRTPSGASTAGAPSAGHKERPAPPGGVSTE
ncbi:helix-turn-helix domain-containing protein [Sphingomonas histidinilytica]|uniref:helix-turn-helix transcriptional regulator n=1 Tax=Rhizorhabdus histidinilytica TaxID=439228 RepID=UPI001ADAD7C5|nr:AraC family transcriptional regulator [Rhizorhabdus histidinilytica]MBO9380466.1 helix-turn-helix domain-containing protein [Rhizorhabdus histidinilytica]